MWSSAPDRVSGSDQWCEATTRRSLSVSGSTSSRPLPAAARHGRQAGTFGGVEDEGEPLEREDREAEGCGGSVMLATADHQISLTDPDARSMATSGRGSGVVGYNVQVAVETKHWS